jgi:adenosylmethionine-8-amino-7-oxononanoate aminotransferase
VPLGGVLVGPSVSDRLESDPTLVLRHGHTYSGHPTACAAGLANLAILSAENLRGRAEPIGIRLADGLGPLVDGDAVTELRGDGAVWAIELGSGRAANDVREELLNRGVIARPIGTSIIAYCPPLVATDDDIDQIVEATADAIKAVAPVS